LANRIAALKGGKAAELPPINKTKPRKSGAKGGQNKKQPKADR